MDLRWRYGVIAGLFLAVFSLYPQFKLLYLRGDEWNGHYAYNDIDEVAYAGYLKALIDGRPRKNDPYTGRDDSPDAPQPESLFSIQFIAPYTIALPARILGVDAPWAMTISGAVAAFLTALIIFWLLGMITGDSLFAMAGSLVVLCGGALFAGEGAIGEILGTGYSYPYFPGFRRYLPAMAFPAFFALLALVWRLLGQSREGGLRPRNAALLVGGVSLAFAYTVYSYFFVWTAAAAFLGIVFLIWLVVRPSGWKPVGLLAAAGIGGGMLMLPYAYLLSNRAGSTDDVQVLVRTHAPDLTRTPELISFLVLGLLLIGVMRKVWGVRDPAVLFVAALAATQLAVFNQQIITGRSLQPIHYQVFIGNYIAGLSLVALVGMLWQRAPRRDRFLAKAAAWALALLATVWGFVECHYTVRVLDDVNIIRDEALPVGRRLAELARSGTDPLKTNVLYLGLAEADDLPTLAPQPLLWARHQHIFAGVTTEENRERYYQYLYYSNVLPSQLAEGMKHNGDFVSMIALFGWGRHTDRLNADYKPLTFREIDEAAEIYARYIGRFDARGPQAVPLSYLIIPADGTADLENIDRWYQRDTGEIFGKYVLFRLYLRK